MAGVKISALPAVPAAPQLTDIMPEVQPPVGGVTYKVTLNQLLTLFQANIQIAESQVTNLVTDLAAKVNRSGDTMTGFLILNADPVLPLGAATKQYVDSIAQGLNILTACYAASTVALTVTYSNGVAGVGATLTNAGAQATFSIDGVTPPLNSRILIKNQVSTFQNGIYTVTNVGSGATNWILTRATDYDQASEINPGDFVLINFGTANTATAWIETATVTTVGTDPILWSAFGSVVALPLALASGGTGAALTASNGGIFYSTATTGAILAGTATARQMLQSGATAPPAWSTSTWPATTTINQILFSSAANVVGGISTANSSILITSAGGVPSFSTTIPSHTTDSITFSPTTHGLVGTNTNDAAAAGYVGELQQVIISSGSAVSLTTNTAANVATLSLGAGDWDLYGNVDIVAASVGASFFICWISSISATAPAQPLFNGLNLTTALIQSTTSLNAPFATIQLNGTTNVFLSAFATFAGTLSVCGGLYARRRR